MNCFGSDVVFEVEVDFLGFFVGIGLDGWLGWIVVLVLRRE